MKIYIVADNQFITSEGLVVLLRKISGDDSVILRVKTKKELQDKLTDHPAAIVVLDYTLFDFISLEQMLIVKAAYKRSSWVLFSEELGESFLRRVLAIDPTLSIVMKQDSEKQLLMVLQSASEGIPCICESVEQLLQSAIKENVAQSDKLTPSEKVILREIAMGKTTKEIAYEKNLSFHTVNSHRKNIFRKLEINNVHEAVKYAIRAGILDIAEYYI